MNIKIAEITHIDDLDQEKDIISKQFVELSKSGLENIKEFEKLVCGQISHHYYAMKYFIDKYDLLYQMCEDYEREDLEEIYNDFCNQYCVLDMVFQLNEKFKLKEISEEEIINIYGELNIFNYVDYANDVADKYDFTIEEMNNCLLTNMFILNQIQEIIDKTAVFDEDGAYDFEFNIYTEEDAQTVQEFIDKILDIQSFAEVCEEVEKTVSEGYNKDLSINIIFDDNYDKE